MKTIKINYIGFWKSFNKTNNVFYNILKNRYIVEISDKPDYVFVSPLGKSYEFLKYDCIRIFYAGEEIVPDYLIMPQGLMTLLSGIDTSDFLIVILVLICKISVWV